VSSSCQFASIVASVVLSINDLLRSVRTATSPTSAVKASKATSEDTTNVSVIARAGSCDGLILPEPSSPAYPLTASLADVI